LSKKYLEEHKGLNKIAKKIEIGYPLGFKFNLSIVDTPGVNARGGLKKATIDYIMNANAAIFIHTIKNIASESLEKFFRESDQAKKSIFLFLTHKAQSTKKDVEETLEEAKKLFPEIDSERVVAVDSVLKQIHDEMEAGKAWKSFRPEEEKWKLLAPYILDFGETAVEQIKNALLKDSNFSTIQDLLSKFSEKARNLQLKYIVEEIKKGYEKQQNFYKEQIGLRHEKLTKTPEAFGKEINELKRLLDQYLKFSL
jgi:hypothetical protein